MLFRSGLRWSDGHELTAADFAFTYRAMREQSVFSGHFLEGVEAEATDPRTLDLRLAEPRAELLYLLAQLAFFPWPRHRVESLGDDWRAPGKLVGNGPFVIAEFGEDSALLATNPLWCGSRGNIEELAIGLRPASEALDEWNAGRHDFLLATRLRETPSTDRKSVV